MSKNLVRGACPRLAAPMETGDGLLARIVPAGPMSLDAFASLCAAAGAHGNGLMEISARGSLQVRGLTPLSAPLFAARVESLAIDLCDRVPVLAGPLPGDPATLIDAQALAADIRGAIGAHGLSLAPKVSVIVDGGGPLHLDPLAADIRLRAVASSNKPKLLVLVAGDAATATPLGLVTPEDATDVVVALLAVIAAFGADSRARDVLRHGGIAGFHTVTDHLEPTDPLIARAPAETIGLHRLKGRACAMGVALPFGQANAADLMALAAIAKANGAAWAATAPGRTLLLGPIDEMTGFVLATAADHLGFIVDARDARRRIVACPGAPACASGLIAARLLGAEIAGALPPSVNAIAVHVSGCAKGCAHPGRASLTIVGTEDGCGIIRNGTARGTPERTVAARDLVAEVVKGRETADA